METVNVHQAKTNLSKLLAQVENGLEVTIARNGKPVARLIPFGKRGTPQPDVFKGAIQIPDSFFEPLPAEELEAWEGEDC